jgi:hypothetical protein
VANVIRRHPVTAYFALTFLISWTGAFLVVLPYLVRHTAIPKMAGLMMFPVMLLGPASSGLFLTWLVDGTGGLRDLFRRMRRFSAGKWYAALFIASVLVPAVLRSLGFTPNLFLIGISTGSVLLAQLMHASSTGSLVIFSPPGVSASQEVFWYAVYACALWALAGIIALRFGKSLTRGNRQ